MRTRTFPKHDFAKMNAEEIAIQVEEDIKSLARKWKHAHSKSSQINRNAAAIETAALYLQANHALYFRDERQAMKDMHQHWMLLMEQWFHSVFERRGKRNEAVQS